MGSAPCHARYKAQGSRLLTSLQGNKASSGLTEPSRGGWVLLGAHVGQLGESLMWLCPGAAGSIPSDGELRPSCGCAAAAETALIHLLLTSFWLLTFLFPWL